MALNTIASIVINSAVIFGGLLIFGLIIILFIRIYLNFKRYDYVCIIYDRVTGTKPIQTKDLGGIYVDNRTKNKRFYLKKNNVGLNPDNIPYIMGEKGQKYVYLLKTGLKNFRFLDINIQQNARFTISVGEEDVNWALNAYERNKKMFGTTLLQQILPYIGIALMGVFILGMLVVVLNKLSVLQDVAIAFKELAEVYAQTQGGTAILK